MVLPILFVCFPCMFYCFPDKTSCQLEVASLCVASQYVYTAWSADVCLSVCVWLAWASSGAKCCFWCLFQALQLNFSPSPHVESFSYLYMYLNMWMTAFLFCFLMTLALLRNLVPFWKKKSRVMVGPYKWNHFVASKRKNRKLYKSCVLR